MFISEVGGREKVRTKDVVGGSAWAGEEGGDAKSKARSSVQRRPFCRASSLFFLVVKKTKVSQTYHLQLAKQFEDLEGCRPTLEGESASSKTRDASFPPPLAVESRPSDQEPSKKKR